MNQGQEVWLYILSPEAASSSFKGKVVTANNNLLTACKTYMPGFYLLELKNSWLLASEGFTVTIRCLPLQVYNVETYGNIIYIIR